MNTSIAAPVRLDNVRQKTIREYIRDKGLFVSSDFEKLKPTCYKPAEIDTYHIHSKSFRVEADLEQVWGTYLSISPEETWRCQTVSFGFMYCKKSKTISYAQDEYAGLREGQVPVSYTHLDVYKRQVLSAPAAYKLENAKSKAGINIYKAIADATGTNQFVFDWDANFTIGFLLSLP